MPDIKDIIMEINKLRENLYEIIELRDYNLNDPDVLEASNSLNQVIENYFVSSKDKII